MSVLHAVGYFVESIVWIFWKGSASNLIKSLVIELDVEYESIFLLFDTNMINKSGKDILFPS